jgi:hypothetical protein
MAAVDNAVCYSTWIDGGGPNMGRVDVVNLKKAEGDKTAYSFNLPTGVIHGATANSGRVFFAPADGVCWIDADTSLSKTAETVVVNHLSLGKDEDAEKPNRTGAFVNHRNWVLFTTGGGESKSSLCLMEANATPPRIVKLPIAVEEGLTLTTPDPNGDRNFSDAAISKTLPVGASKVDGHNGHHAIGFDSEGRIACFTNPGEGSIWVLSLKDLTIRAKSIVGGTPGAIVAIGAPEHKH